MRKDNLDSLFIFLSWSVYYEAIRLLVEINLIGWCWFRPPSRGKIAARLFSQKLQRDYDEGAIEPVTFDSSVCCFVTEVFENFFKSLVHNINALTFLLSFISQVLKTNFFARTPAVLPKNCVKLRKY